MSDRLELRIVNLINPNPVKLALIFKLQTVPEECISDR